ncbi:unnamed protein product, partial [Staurois parvus]
LVGYLFGRFSVFWQIFFIGKVGKKNRPIFTAMMGKSADFLPIKNLRMSSDLQEEDKKK